MSRSMSARRLMAGALTTVLAGSLLTTATAGSAQAADGPRTVHVKITKYHYVKMPDVIRPGLHRFVVDSTKEGGFHIVQPVRAQHHLLRRRVERGRQDRGGLDADPGRPVRGGRHRQLGALPEQIPASGLQRFRDRSDANHFVGLSQLKPGKRWPTSSSGSSRSSRSTRPSRRSTSTPTPTPAPAPAPASSTPAGR